MTGALAVVSSGYANLIVVSPTQATGAGTTTTVQTNIVAASSPVPGATFAWTYESGDDTISVLAPSSAFTRWSASGLELPELREAVWRVTAFSSGFPFATVTVPVSIQRI